MQNLTLELISFLKNSGAALAGVADLTIIEPEARQGLPRGIVFALALDPGVIAGINHGPTSTYYREYQQVNARLDDLGRRTAAFIQAKGYQVRAQGATAGVDWQTLAVKLPHKTVATRAGLGWIGKCALLVTREYGSALRFNSLLTDAPLEAGTPVEKSQCGNCNICVENCPGNAPTGRHWQAGDPRETLFDAFACEQTARRLCREGFGQDARICGRCIVSCPWTRKYLQQYNSG